MGIGTIPDRINGTVIDETWFNLLKIVLSGDFVPRDVTGVVGALQANLGNATYPWSALTLQLIKLRALNNTNVVNLKVPDSLGGNYAITLPTALPGSGNKILFIDSSGQATISIAPDGSTIEVSGNDIRVKASGITTNELADSSVTTSKIAPGAVGEAELAALSVGSAELQAGSVVNSKLGALSVTSDKIASKAVGTAELGDKVVTAAQVADATLTGSQIVSSINLPGDTVQENSKNVIVSSVNAASSLSVIRGFVQSDGSITSGEGFSVVKNGTGNFTITFDNHLADLPMVISGNLNFNTGSNTYNISQDQFTIQTTQFDVNADVPFTFVVIGRR